MTEIFLRECSEDKVVHFGKMIKRDGIRVFDANSCNRWITIIMPVVERFGREPLCSPGRIPTSLSRRRVMISISILPACASSEVRLFF